MGALMKQRVVRVGSMCALAAASAILVSRSAACNVLGGKCGLEVWAGLTLDLVFLFVSRSVLSICVGVFWDVTSECQR